MVGSLERRHSACIQGVLLALGALQERQALVERRVLQITGLCHERVADGRRLREQGWDPWVSGHFSYFPYFP